jgi:proteasome lid subunit RPN8/RPN11
MRRLWGRNRVDRVDRTGGDEAGKAGKGETERGEAVTSSTVAIRKELLLALIEASKSMHPHEFIALLTGRKVGKRNIIEEFIMLPYESGETMAVIQTHALPIGIKIMGTVHSHPSPNPAPSEEDLNMFASYGRVHIIIHHPYCRSCWRAYDARGEEIGLEVIE